MVCIYCGYETDVTNSRSKARTPSVWRRRSCKHCVAQFTTLELPDYTKSLLVKTIEDKKLLAFSRDKLYVSIHKSLSHRGDAIDSSTALTTTIIGSLLRKGMIVNGMLRAHAIAETSFSVLKRFDPLAAATYKAYHQAALKK